MARRARKPVLSFGMWPSPIAAQDLTRGARSFGHRQGDGGWLYWSESRPEEKGRQVIMRTKAGSAPEEVLPEPFSARSRVHEYGGGEFTVVDAVAYFVNEADQDVWSVEPGGLPKRLTREPGTRFSSMTLDGARSRLLAVAERHDDAGEAHTRPENSIVAVPLGERAEAKPQPLIEGRDFYAFPTISPDGTRVAFLAWDLPDMPWDQAALYVAEFGEDGQVGRPGRVAGGSGVAIMQPQWLSDGWLVFLTDACGWGNLAIWDGKSVRDLTQLKIDLGLPMWNLGARSFIVDGRGRLQAAASVDGRPALVVVEDLDASSPKITISPLPEGVAGLGTLAAIGTGVGVAATMTYDHRPATLGLIGSTGEAPVVLRASSELDLDLAGVSIGRQVQFRSGDDRTTYARYYPPASATHQGPRGALPPGLVLAHGGPTAAAGRGLAMRVQYYTSRGFAVLDVDYAGSTGYGRAYRERLDGAWGIADVEDCAAAASWAGREGLVDPGRVAIAGGSAGGYTVLMALARTRGVFAAGSSHYGISDLVLLMEHTHKFEAGYLHRLLGTTPRAWRAICETRSPLTHIDDMRVPAILFQGLEDKVVPPEQSRLIADRLRAKGVRVELHEFEGEGHGFRRAETIVAVFEAELSFLRSAMAIS